MAPDAVFLSFAVTVASLSLGFTSFSAPANMPASLPAPFCLMYELVKSVIKSASSVSLSLVAVLIALSNAGSFGLLLKDLSRSERLTSSVTLIPPCKSKPRFSSFALHCLYVFPKIG